MTLGYFRRKAVAWEAAVSQLSDLVHDAPGRHVHGTLHGIELHLRSDEASGVTSVEACLPDDRFALRIDPVHSMPTRQAADPAFEACFRVHGTPLDLPRFVLDPELRAMLLAIEPRPTVVLAPPVLMLEVTGSVDAPAMLVALEVTARLARSLAERAAMCARPA